MRQNNLLCSIYKSFYSKELYRDVYQNWGFSIIAYLLLLIIIYGGTAGYGRGQAFYKAFNLTVNEFVNQFPTGKIINGKMTIEGTSPHQIALHPEIINTNLPKQTLVIFDMSDKITPAESPAVLIFHSNGYYYITEHKTEQPLIQVKKTKSIGEPGAQNAYQFTSYPIIKKPLHFSKEQARKWADKIKWTLPLTLLLLVCIGQFIFKLIQGIAYAFLALIFSVCCKVKLTYGQAYRLSIISMTPAFFLITLSGFYLEIQHAWLIAFIFEIGYLFFAVYANRSNCITKTCA